MQLLVVYDIPDDGKRAKVADVCLDFGLDRIQYSVFSGVLNQTHQKALLHKLKSTLGKRPGKIMVLPIGKEQWEGRQEILIDAPSTPSAALSAPPANLDPQPASVSASPDPLT